MTPFQDFKPEIKLFLIVAAISAVLAVGGILLFAYFNKSTGINPITDDQCSKVPGKVGVTFREPLLPKEMKAFAESKGLAIAYEAQLSSQPIIVRIKKEESAVDAKEVERQLRELFTITEISKVHSAGTTGPDLRTKDYLFNYIPESPLLTVTFSGKEVKVREAIERNMTAAHIVEKKFLQPQISEKTNQQQLVLQFGYEEAFDVLKRLTETNQNLIKEAYYLGSGVIEIHFSPELGKVELLSILAYSGVRPEEFIGIQNDYNFKSLLLAVPNGEEQAWSTILKGEEMIESAQQEQICPPAIIVD